MSYKREYDQYLKGAVLNKHHYNKNCCKSNIQSNCNYKNIEKVEKIKNNINNNYCNSFQDVVYEYESLNCVSNEKSKKALHLKEEANRIVQYATELRDEADNLKHRLEDIIYESEQCLKKAHDLNIESNLLMQESNIALNKEIESKRKLKEC